MNTLFVKQFVDPGLGNSSYLIASEETGLAAVIDPQRDVDKYLQVAQGLGLRLVYALDTHLHADFVSGALELAHGLQSTNEFRIGASAHAGLLYDHQPLSEGDRVSLGNLSIDVMATPGHTPEHISYAVYQNGSEAPGAVFSGGSLIVGGAGRSDLLGHEHAVALASAQFRTLHEKLLKLPDEIVVYPTHGGGSFCITPASNERVTTIGRERKHNPLAHIHNQEEFVKQALTGLPNYPTYYRYMRSINQKGGRLLGGVPQLTPLPPHAVRHLIDSGAVVIDIRSTRQFVGRHIPSSYGIPLATPLTTWAGWVVPFGSPVILVADTPEEREEAVRQLIRIGYDDLCGYLDGGVEAWLNAGYAVSSWQSVNAQDLHEWLAQKVTPFVLDVRANSEWAQGHLPGARHIEAGALPEMARGNVPHDRPVVAHCARGNRSTVALSILEQKGYQNLFALEDGISSWLQAGYEIVQGGEE